MITKNFDDAWRAVEPRLLAALRARGTDPDTARDISQEVALRAVVTGVPFDDAPDLLRWALVVGRRLAANHRRDHARLIVGEVPERATAHCPERIVAGRLAVAAVATALASLTVEERTLLTDRRSVAPTRREQVHLAVRRHRARSRLRALLGGLTGAAAGALGLRRLVRREAVVAAALVPVLVASIALVPQQSPSSPAPAAAPARPASTSAGSPPASEPRPPTVAPVAKTRPPTLESPVPLAPVHGTELDIPDAAGGRVQVRERTDRDRAVCAVDYPVLGTFCTPI